MVPEPEPPPKPRSRRRLFIAAALVLLLVLAGLAVGREIIRSNYYVSAYDGTVAIMRGIQGSILGYPLQEPYLLGCLNDRNELSQISYGQADRRPGCQLMRLQDLRPSERTQVSAGLPAGSLDNAIGQLRELARSSLLPPCPPPRRRPAPRPHRRRPRRPHRPDPRRRRRRPPSAPAPTTAPRTTPTPTPTAVARRRSDSPSAATDSPSRAADPSPTVTAAAAAAAEAGRRLPGGGMTTQPQPR